MGKGQVCYRRSKIKEIINESKPQIRKAEQADHSSEVDEILSLFSFSLM